MSQRKFADVPGSKYHRVGDDGTVWVLEKNMWKIMMRRRKKKGLLVYINTNGRSPVGWEVGRLLLLSFVGPCPEGKKVIHKNGNVLDCRLINLAYGKRKPKKNRLNPIITEDLTSIGKEGIHICLTYYWVHGISKISIAQSMEIGAITVQHIIDTYPRVYGDQIYEVSDVNSNAGQGDAGVVGVEGVGECGVSGTGCQAEPGDRGEDREETPGAETGGSDPAID